MLIELNLRILALIATLIETTTAVGTLCTSKLSVNANNLLWGEVLCFYWTGSRRAKLTPEEGDQHRSSAGCRRESERRSQSCRVKVGGGVRQPVTSRFGSGATAELSGGNPCMTRLGQRPGPAVLHCLHRETTWRGFLQHQHWDEFHFSSRLG